MNDGNEQSDRLLRLKAAAARLGVSVRTVYRLVAEGQLPLVHVRSCSCLKEADLIAYIERQQGKEKS